MIIIVVQFNPLKKYFYIFLLFFLQNIAFSQTKFLKDPMDIAVMDSADFFFQDKAFVAANIYYHKLLEKYPNEQILLFRIGICYANGPYSNQKALDYFKMIDINNYVKDHSLFYYGIALHYNSQFEEAKTYFENYVKSKNANNELKKIANHKIENCNFAINILHLESGFKIENCGTEINSAYSEFNPVIITDQSQLYFNYAGIKSIGAIQTAKSLESEPIGDYYSDIYTSAISNSEFGKALSFSQELNTNTDQVVVAIRNDGSELFTVNRDDRNDDNLYRLELYGKTWEAPQKLYGKVNSNWNENSLSISADGKTIFFSSDRAGGKGGLDIYTSKLQSDGSWGEAIALPINTEYDETCPFIHSSGSYLFYSSNNKNSVGGFDIFRVEYLNDSTWSEPTNLGLPINSPFDEEYFSVSASGTVAYFSSIRPGGFGKEDIYKVSGNLTPDNIQLLQTGIVRLDEAPLYCGIEVMQVLDGKHQGTYHSNSSTGKYLICFEKNQNLRMIFSINGYAPKEVFIDTRIINSFTGGNIDVNFYSEEYKKNHPELFAIKDTSKTNPVDIIRKKDARFFVQIGAFTKKSKIDFSQLKAYGKIIKKDYGDGLIRYFIGTFTTLEEAQELKLKIIAAGITDAFIAVELDGKKASMLDLTK